MLTLPYVKKPRIAGFHFALDRRETVSLWSHNWARMKDRTRHIFDKMSPLQLELICTFKMYFEETIDVYNDVVRSNLIGK